MREPVFETLQVAIVVRDLEAAMQTYVHDYAIGPWDFYESVAAQAERGNDVVLSGEFSGISVAYFATDWEHGVITEIFSGTPGADLKPDATYA